MRVILFSNARPRLVWRLAVRVEQEAPGATVCGLVRQRPSPAGCSRRQRVRAAARNLAERALGWVHGCPPNPNGPSDFTDEDLIRRSRAAGWPVLITSDPDFRDAYDFVRQQDPDLGVCLQIGTLPEDLLLIPRLGSVAGQSSQSPTPGTGNGDLSPTGTPAALRPDELNIEVVRVEQKAPRGTLWSLTLPREPYDIPASRQLKADLITNDLLVRSVATLAGGGEADGGRAARCPTWTPPPATPSSGDDRRGGRLPGLAAGRPRWRMCLHAAALAPYCVARNWYRRVRGRCPVIILYHHLAADRPHHLGMPTHAFLQGVRFLQRYYRLLSLREAMESLASGSVRVPSVVLTLDDGYRENFLTVRAVMEETGVPLTLFVNPELIEQQRSFPHDLARGESHFLPLTWEQLAYLAHNGAEIGSHTRSHFDCGARDRSALEAEIIGSKHDLERRLGRPVRFFAFPWGQPRNMSPEATEIARAAYSQVFSAYGGQNLPGRTGPSGIRRRGFQSPDLWELELSLQSVFDLGSSLRRALGLRSRSGVRAAAHDRDGSKGMPLET